MVGPLLKRLRSVAELTVSGRAGERERRMIRPLHFACKQQNEGRSSGVLSSHVSRSPLRRSCCVYQQDICIQIGIPLIPLITCGNARPCSMDTHGIVVKQSARTNFFLLSFLQLALAFMLICPSKANVVSYRYRSIALFPFSMTMLPRF